MPSTKIDQGDWRLQVAVHLAEDWTSPWSGLTSPKGTRLTVSSIIQLTSKKLLTVPIPNATAAMLNASARAFESARLIRAASGIDKSLKGDVSFSSEEAALDFIERMIEAIVLAYSAIEAFANESIPSDFIYARHKNSDVVLEASGKDEIERRVSTDEKLTAVLPDVLGCNSPKSNRCWQNYKQLKGVRDRIIHMKTEDRKSSGPEVGTIWKAIVLTPAPHSTAKEVIDYFVKNMTSKPRWHERFLHAS